MTSIDFIVILTALCIPELPGHVRVYHGIVFMTKSLEVGAGLLIRRIWKNFNAVLFYIKDHRKGRIYYVERH